MNGTLVKRKKEIVKHLHELINSSHHFKKLYYNEYKKMYKYKVNLDNVDRKDCGSTLAFNATGFNQWQANSTVLVKRINRQDNHLFCIFWLFPVQTIVTKIH